MADEPRIAKYGLPAALSQPFAAAQTAIAQERALLKELRFADALRVGPSLRAALDALARKGAAPVPVPPPDDPPSVVVTPAPVAPEPVDLRAALGLR